MSNTKTTLLGLIVGALLAAWGVLQPAITGGAVDYKIIIPAVIIAIVGFVQKDNGSWKTTTIGIVLAALVAGASAYQSDPNQWAMVAGAILSAVGGALTKDHDADGSTTIKTS